MTTLASISFTDAIGAVVVTNLKPEPGDRFSDWNPDSDAVGPADVGLGTGLIHHFSFRDDYLVSFELRAIPNTELDKLLRLQTYLLDGNLVAIACENVMAATYASCGIAPGSEPTIQFSDNNTLEYTLGLKLLAVP